MFERSKELDLRKPPQTRGQTIGMIIRQLYVAGKLTYRHTDDSMDYFNPKNSSSSLGVQVATLPLSVGIDFN